MSKICLITAQNVQMSPDSLRRRIVDFSAERNIDCWYNGTCSSAPFAERMNSVCDIVRYAADCSGEVELFIGDCGQCPLTEFEPASVRLECLHENLVRMFNDYNAPQARIRIIRQLSSE